LEKVKVVNIKYHNGTMTTAKLKKERTRNINPALGRPVYVHQMNSFCGIKKEREIEKQ